MIAVGCLYTAGGYGEVLLAMCRSIFESATNVRYLLKKNSKDLFDKFVLYSLIPDRKLFDEIQSKITARGGVVLPIEKRMIASITHSCSVSGCRIEDVPSKGRFEDGVGSLRERLTALGTSDRYNSLQGIPSHTVHGDWVDIVLFHVTHENGRFRPHPEFSTQGVDTFLPVCLIVLDAVGDYLRHYYPNSPDASALLNRADGLSKRILRVFQAQESFRAASKS